MRVRKREKREMRVRKRERRGKSEEERGVERVRKREAWVRVYFGRLLVFFFCLYLLLSVRPSDGNLTTRTQISVSLKERTLNLIKRALICVCRLSDANFKFTVLLFRQTLNSDAKKANSCCASQDK